MDIEKLKQHEVKEKLLVGADNLDSEEHWEKLKDRKCHEKHHK